MKKLLLLGGGHAHAYALSELRRKPLRDTEVTLVSPYTQHTYSGMLPGYISGHYSAADIQIDLARLSRESGVALVLDRAVGLDVQSRTVTLSSGRALEYDLLSLNLGSVPDTRVPGSREHAVAAKPFESFIQRWESEGLNALRIAVIGGGAAGVELSMAFRHRSPDAQVALYSEKPMFKGSVVPRIGRALQRMGVELHAGVTVDRVDAGPVVAAAGIHTPYDFVVLATGATPESWLASSGLSVDDRGFVFVDDMLRSVSHPEVFASGDSATLRNSPHPKSGVFAVRHAPVLLENLRRSVEGGALTRYMPQVKQLALLSCGAKYAIASRGGWSAEGRWAWWWKDWLDRRWIARFS